MKFPVVNQPPTCLHYSTSNLASQFAHILAYAAWMGSTVWTTFVAGITMMRNLPRQQFGKLQVGADTTSVCNHVGTLDLLGSTSAGSYKLRSLDKPRTASTLTRGPSSFSSTSCVYLLAVEAFSCLFPAQFRRNNGDLHHPRFASRVSTTFLLDAHVSSVPQGACASAFL